MRIALAISLLLALGRVAFADDQPAADQGRGEKGAFGIGVVFGEPTGITAKLYLRDDRAIDAALGEAFAAGGVDFHADYLFHPWILQNRDTFVLPVYLGPGLRFIDYFGGTDASNHVALGLRAVGGILFDFKNVPLDVFIEIAGIGQYDFGAGKGFGLGGSAGAGIRYYF